MALLFHQNMRVFGGGSAPRNAVFNASFAAISGITGQIYWAAGFTEISNNTVSMVQLPVLAAVIDPGLTSLVLVKVGLSALGYPEWTGISWDPAVFNIQHAGQVLKNPMNGIWTTYDTPMAGAVLPLHINIPNTINFTADARGPAYIAGINILNGNPYILMFFHNMYAMGDKTGAFNNLPSMADSIRTLLGGVYGNAEAIVGGDFNLWPRLPTRVHNLAGNVPLKFSATINVATNSGYANTTYTNAYDYWLSSDNNVTNIDDTIYAQTRVALGSDHAGVTLTV